MQNNIYQAAMQQYEASKAGLSGQSFGEWLEGMKLCGFFWGA